jgi:putative lipase involved disintegration of autophagic bodies
LLFPDAKIWVIGHSLGGSLASLVGITFGVPVVTFEPPGERMAAARLHLPSPVRIYQPHAFMSKGLQWESCSHLRIT